MKKLLAVVVFAVVCLFAAAPAFAQEEPVAEDSATDIEELPMEEAAPVDEVAQKLMDGGLVVEKGANANVNLNKNVVNVPDEMTVRGEVDANVTGSIDVKGRLKVERADMTWCERHQVGCGILKVGGGILAAGFVIGGGLYAADRAGLLDTENNVGFSQ